MMAWHDSSAELMAAYKRDAEEIKAGLLAAGVDAGAVALVKVNPYGIAQVRSDLLVDAFRKLLPPRA